MLRQLDIVRMYMLARSDPSSRAPNHTPVPNYVLTRRNVPHRDLVPRRNPAKRHPGNRNIIRRMQLDQRRLSRSRTLNSHKFHGLSSF